MAAKGVTNEGQRVTLLLHSGGIELQEIYYILVAEDQDISFNDCVAVLDNYFTPKVNVPFERHVSAKCNRWKEKLSINLCAVCARRLYPVNFQAWMEPSEIRSSKNAEIQNEVLDLCIFR